MSGFYANYDDHCLGQTAATGTRPFLDTDTIKVGLVNGGTDYAENLATDTTMTQTGYTPFDTCYGGEACQTLANKTIVDGVFDNTEDITFTAVDIDTAKSVDAIVHYLATGVLTTDTLICFHDGFTAVVPNGGDIVIAYHASGIFKR